MVHLTGKRVTVIGAARSGRAAAALLASAGADVFVSDSDDIPSAVRDGLTERDIDFESGGHTARALEAELIVVSPGVPLTVDILERARERGIPVRGELEMASWFCRAPILAITGTNGKTTTTRLVEHVFQTASRPHRVAGNMGTPFSAVVGDLEADGTAILEVSSFQLDSIDRFRPAVGVLLNITPDHLKRYGGNFEAYSRSKCRIFENQRAEDKLIYNADDARIREAVEGLPQDGSPERLAISCEGIVEKGAYIRAGSPDQIVLHIESQEEELMTVDELALRGRHNQYNSLAAAVAARARDIQNEDIRRSLESFRGVEHRLEAVREIDGVLYVNDSKATNVNAVWYALDSFDRPVVLIAGGRDKGNDYSLLRPLVRDRVRAVIAIGESADKVERELGQYAAAAVRADSMETAVREARQLSRAGDVVLLSPACSSFDMFEDYEHRGNVFKAVVQNLTSER